MQAIPSEQAAEASKTSKNTFGTIAKGTRDLTPADVTIRDKLIQLAKSIFVLHGAVGIKTPVFELYETLMNKYGEDQKLIYELDDQGGQKLGLRYDLTVPMCRYIATYKLDELRRYQIDTVNRRDQPDMTKGRFREFYQCDFDIVGSYKSMLPDAEILHVVHEFFSALKDLGLGSFVVKLNHRKVLDRYFVVCGVPASMIRTVSSSVDKLDKLTWIQVKEELLTKGLDEQTADRLYAYTQMNGTLHEIIAKLQACDLGIDDILVELQTLERYLNEMDSAIVDNIIFDLSLARGLDYYTGLVYEIVLPGFDSSVGGGGRYDNMVIGNEKGKKGKVCTIPAVGVSFGFDRLMTMLTSKIGSTNEKIYDVVILYSSVSEAANLSTAIQLANALRNRKQRTLIEYNAYGKRQLGKLLSKHSHDCKYVAMVGQVTDKIVCKNMDDGSQNEYDTVAEAV